MVIAFIPPILIPVEMINISNYTSATASDINKLGDLLLTATIKRINDLGRINDGQMGVLIATEAGVETIIGHQNSVQELLKLVQQYRGKILLKSFVRFNPLNPHAPIHEIVINQMAFSYESEDKHIVTATIEHDANWVYSALVTKVRGHKI